jgi:site-specific DNA-cytosine methylase
VLLQGGLRSSSGPGAQHASGIDQDSLPGRPAAADAGSATAEEYHKGLPESMDQLGLRFFTPREVANLHSFPDAYEFPADVTLRQRYALLGNSLSVEVVFHLLQYLLAA